MIISSKTPCRSVNQTALRTFIQEVVYIRLQWHDCFVEQIKLQELWVYISQDQTLGIEGLFFPFFSSRSLHFIR